MNKLGMNLLTKALLVCGISATPLMAQAGPWLSYVDHDKFTEYTYMNYRDKNGHVRYEYAADNPANAENNPWNSGRTDKNLPENNLRTNRVIRSEGRAIGYYVRSDKGIINYFSIDGERLFYTPCSGSGIFRSKTGEHVGYLLQPDHDHYHLILDKSRVATIY